LLGDGELAVLRAMSTITRSTDMDEFLRLVGLTSAELTETLRDLAKEGFVTKTGKGYAIAEKGKTALKARMVFPEGSEFSFYVAVGQPAGLSARSLVEFYEVVGKVDVASLEFHLYRGDFENWVKAIVGDAVLASEFESLRHGELKGESLREKLAAVIEARYGAEALK